MNEILFDEKLSKGRVAYERLASLQHRIVNTNEEELSVQMQNAGRCGKTFVFIIACLRYLALTHKKRLKIFVPPKIYNYLGDLDVLRSPESLDQKGYRFTVFKSNDVLIDSVKQIVAEIPVSLSERLCQDLISRIGEIFNNAFEHAEAEYVIGARYPKPNRKYCFTCYDTGVGISNKVRCFLKNSELTMSDQDALDWALNRRNSTAADKTKPRGQGMALLHEFANLNKGTIRICTGKTLYTYSGEKGSVTWAKLKEPFIGTLFEMDFNADDKRYKYKSE
jgi:hypothetical protein